MEDPELDDEFDEEDEEEDPDFLSEPSTSLSIGHDTLHHLMPPPFVPTLCMRLLRLESRENNNSSDPPWSVRSTRPPPPPHNHGFHTDEVLLPANRPENFIDPNHIFFKTQPPTQPIQRQPIQPTQPTMPQQPQRIIHTHRHVRPSTTDPGTLTARHANPNVPSTHDIARQRPSSTSATHRKRPTRKTKTKTKKKTTATTFFHGHRLWCRFTQRFYFAFVLLFLLLHITTLGRNLKITQSATKSLWSQACHSIQW